MSIALEAKRDDVYMINIDCLNENCLTRLRIGRFLKLPTTRVGVLSFCPMCGGRAVAQKDTGEDYWESLAEVYELPVEHIIAIHNIWNVREYPVFADFVTYMKEAAKKLSSN